MKQQHHQTVSFLKCHTFANTTGTRISKLLIDRCTILIFECHLSMSKGFAKYKNVKRVHGRLDDDQSVPCRATAATPHFSTPFGSLPQAAAVVARRSCCRGSVVHLHCQNVPQVWRLISAL
jgi:hypothetical protein